MITPSLLPYVRQRVRGNGQQLRDARARGGTLKGGELLVRPNDGEAGAQPIGVRQPQRRGPAVSLGALGRTCQVVLSPAARRGYRHFGRRRLRRGAVA